MKTPTSTPAVGRRFGRVTYSDDGKVAYVEWVGDSPDEAAIATARTLRRRGYRVVFGDAPRPQPDLGREQTEVRLTPD
jgi:hypothetical protein